MIVVALLAIIHVYIFVFETFLWERRGPHVFDRFPRELFAPTKALAANQGLYNLFLAAGLGWSLIIGDDEWQRNVAVCFLLFVAVAGIYGAFTASTKTLFVQAVPAAIGLGLVLFT